MLGENARPARESYRRLTHPRPGKTFTSAVKMQNRLSFKKLFLRIKCQVTIFMAILVCIPVAACNFKSDGLNVILQMMFLPYQKVT